LEWAADNAVNAFMALLAPLKHRISGAAAASSASSDALRNAGTRVLDLNELGSTPVYIDGTDLLPS